MALVFNLIRNMRTPPEDSPKKLKTVADRITECGDRVRARLAPMFARIGIAYPPKRIVLMAMKHERVLEVWVAGEAAPLRHLETIPILGASGKLGPKLAEGDHQVPEGIYGIESLNPNSRHHVALRVGYPNDFDKARARREGRENLGGDIMIHGGSSSAGCLAIGDQAAEDLFILAALTGIENVTLIASPMDFRKKDFPAKLPQEPEWVAGLYDQVKAEMRKLKEKGE